MALLLVLIAFAATCYCLYRFRRPPAVHVMTIVLWLAALALNQWVLSTCSGDCNIRVDLVFTVPPVLISTAMSVLALIRSSKV